MGRTHPAQLVGEVAASYTLPAKSFRASRSRSYEFDVADLGATDMQVHNQFRFRFGLVSDDTIDSVNIVHAAPCVLDFGFHNS